MSVQEIQAEIGTIIEKLNQFKRSNEIGHVNEAIQKLIKLRSDVASGSSIGGFPGGPPLFHKNDQF